MFFYIIIQIELKNYNLLVEQTSIDKVKETYKISSKSQTILLENNRPIFRNKGLKHRRPNWKITEKPLRLQQHTIDKIIAEINKKLEI